MAKTVQTFTISELAAQLAISPSSIRFYEEKGLIRPGRTSGNQRLYTKKDRTRMKLILRGKRLGFSLDEIAEMIGLADSSMSEVSQIEKSLVYAGRKLEEIEQRKIELALLEEDILSVRAVLLDRLKELKSG
jgi:DNA-binding transcriptional MerR regulator